MSEIDGSAVQASSSEWVQDETTLEWCKMVGQVAWKVEYTEEDHPYYVNTITGESQWEEPGLEYDPAVATGEGQYGDTYWAEEGGDYTEGTYGEGTYAAGAESYDDPATHHVLEGKQGGSESYYYDENNADEQSEWRQAKLLLAKQPCHQAPQCRGPDGSPCSRSTEQRQRRIHRTMSAVR